MACLRLRCILPLVHVIQQHTSQPAWSPGPRYSIRTHYTRQSRAGPVRGPCCSPFRSTSLMSQPAALSLTPQMCTQTHIRAQTHTHYTPLSLRGINQRTDTTDSHSVQVNGYSLGALNKRSSKSETDLNNGQCEHQTVCPADILHRHIWLRLMCYSVPPVGL